MAGLEPARALYGPTDFKSDRFARYLHLLDTNLTRNPIGVLSIASPFAFMRKTATKLSKVKINERPFWCVTWPKIGKGRASDRTSEKVSTSAERQRDFRNFRREFDKKLSANSRAGSAVYFAGRDSAIASGPLAHQGPEPANAARPRQLAGEAVDALDCHSCLTSGGASAKGFTSCSLSLDGLRHCY